MIGGTRQARVVRARNNTMRDRPLWASGRAPANHCTAGTTETGSGIRLFLGVGGRSLYLGGGETIDMMPAPTAYRQGRTAATRTIGGAGSRGGRGGYRIGIRWQPDDGTRHTPTRPRGGGCDVTVVPLEFTACCSAAARLRCGLWKTED